MRKKPPTLSSLRIVAALVCVLEILSVGCGGGSASPAGGSTTVSNSVEGNWEFQLSYSQPIELGYTHFSFFGNSRIALNLTQIAPGASSSSLISNGLIKGADIGCRSSGGSGWASGGGYEPTASFTVVSGSIQSAAIALVLNESNATSIRSNSELPIEDHLTFMGTLDGDGSMSGTVSDGCVRNSSGNPKQGTWTGKRISALP